MESGPGLLESEGAGSEIPSAPNLPTVEAGGLVSVTI